MTGDLRDRRTRRQIKREQQLAEIAEQVERGELVVRQATADELEALERAAARRRSPIEQAVFDG